MSKVFCHLHGYYDCPVCAGKPMEWLIPIVTNGVETGMVTITEQGDASVIGTLKVPWSESSDAFIPYSPHPPAKEIHVVAVADPIEVPLPQEYPNPRLAEQIAASFSGSIFERMMENPRWRKAAAKGREIHERAVTLSKKEDIPYPEAIRLLTE